MTTMTNYNIEDMTPSLRKYLGIQESAYDSGTSDGAKKGWLNRTRGLKVLPHKDYYNDYGCREIAHSIKNGENGSYEIAARDMARHVGPSDILVPIPGHKGIAIETKILASAISRLSGSTVWDGLYGKNRNSLYEMKKKGYPSDCVDFGFMVKDRKPKGRIVLVDNVLDTGATARAASNAIHSPYVLVHSCRH